MQRVSFLQQQAKPYYQLESDPKLRGQKASISDTTSTKQ